MKEALKSVVLVSLVVSSVLLAGLHWVGPMGLLAEDSISREIRSPGRWGPPPAPSDLLFPRRLVIHAEGGVFEVTGPPQVHDDLWANTVSALREARIGQTVSETDQKAWGSAASGAMELLFPIRLTLPQWALVLGLPSGGLSTEVGVDRVLVPDGDPNFLMIYDESRSRYFRLSLGQPLGRFREEVLKDAILLEVDRILPSELSIPASPHLYGSNLLEASLLAVEPENLSPDTVAAEFLFEPSATQTIVERDGSKVFTDGQRSLRVLPGDKMEYLATPRLKTGGSVPQGLDALRQALDFIGRVGGFMPGSFLSEWTLITGDQGRRSELLFSFDYRYKGWPIVAEPPSVTLVVSGNQVARYTRKVMRPVSFTGAVRAVHTPEEILSRVAAAWESLFPRGQRPTPVRDIFKAYYHPGEGTKTTFSPVWVVEFVDGKRIVFDAYTGSEIKSSPSTGL
ncbi:MAG: hypothetical protein HYY09_03660 [Firmicutes bacterium]|nr:hypothetical protein [Bacillota bacterium]